MHHYPPLADIARDQSVLLREGQIVWAGLIQANELIFKSGLKNRAGALIYSRDPAMDRQPHLLNTVADRLFDMRGEELGNDFQSVAIANMLDGVQREDKDLPVPTGISEGIECYVTNVWFERRHLPGGRLVNGNAMPILVDPRMCAAIVVPHWHWPKDL